MNEQTIFRVTGPNRSYTKLSNVLLADATISFECKGFLVSVLRLPPDWAFNIAWLRKTFGTSKNKAYALVSEAIKCGYCKRVHARTATGNLTGATEYLFSDDPQDLAQFPSDEAQPISPNQGNRDNRYPDFPEAAKSGRLLKTDSNYKEKGESEPRLSFEGQRIKLGQELWDFWLPQFDDQPSLELALIEAAAYIQPNSSKPLEAQVSAQLARRARDRRERDTRYARAASSRPPQTAQQSRIDKSREVLAMIRKGATQ